MTRRLTIKQQKCIALYKKQTNSDALSPILISDYNAPINRCSFKDIQRLTNNSKSLIHRLD